LIEVESSSAIRTSPEMAWRHLTRVSDWYRWYPGLHGVNATEPITRIGQEWRGTGQMGRMLYRSQQRVTDYKLLSHIELEGKRHPWLRSCLLRFRLVPEGANCRLSVKIIAEPGFSLPGRIVLSRLLRRKLQNECDQIVERLASYVEGTMPYH
jgi:hypothetical protein